MVYYETKISAPKFKDYVFYHMILNIGFEKILKFSKPHFRTTVSSSAQEGTLLTPH